MIKKKNNIKRINDINIQNYVNINNQCDDLKNALLKKKVVKNEKKINFSPIENSKENILKEIDYSDYNNTFRNNRTEGESKEIENLTSYKEMDSNKYIFSKNNDFVSPKQANNTMYQNNLDFSSNNCSNTFFNSIEIGKIKDDLKINVKYINWGKNISNYYNGINLSSKNKFKNFKILENKNLKNSTLKGTMIKKEQFYKYKKSISEEINEYNLSSKKIKNKNTIYMKNENKKNSKTRKFSFQNIKAFNNSNNEISNDNKQKLKSDNSVKNSLKNSTLENSKELHNLDNTVRSIDRKNFLEITHKNNNFNNIDDKCISKNNLNDIFHPKIKNIFKCSKEIIEKEKDQNYTDTTNININSCANKPLNEFSLSNQIIFYNNLEFNLKRESTGNCEMGINTIENKFNSNFKNENFNNHLVHKNTMEIIQNQKQNELQDYIYQKDFSFHQKKNKNFIPFVNDKINNLTQFNFFKNNLNLNDRDNKIFLIDELDKLTSITKFKSYSKCDLNKRVYDRVVSDLLKEENENKIKIVDSGITKENLLDLFAFEKFNEEYNKNYYGNVIHLNKFLMNKNVLPNVNNKNNKDNKIEYNKNIINSFQPRSNITSRLLMHSRAKKLFEKKNNFY